MICFKDRTFCASVNCENKCGRKMTDEFKEEANKMDLPICWDYFCEEENT